MSITNSQDPITPAAAPEIGAAALPSACPAATKFTIPGCQDAIRVNTNDTELLSLGRIVQVNVTLKSICPGKKTAVSIILSEIGTDGTQYPRGVKHILVPAHTGQGCQDVRLNCIPFSVPEALNPDGTPGSICGPRNFQTQVIANYVDTDFACCEEETVTI